MDSHEQHFCLAHSKVCRGSAVGSLGWFVVVVGGGPWLDG